MDLQLDTTGDLELTSAGDDLVLVDGGEAIAQDVRTRLRTFQGEWFLNPDIGMPYFQKILGQKPRYAFLVAIFTDAISQTPGIIKISDLVLDFNGEDRILSVNFKADSTAGPIEYKEEFKIL